MLTGLFTHSNDGICLHELLYDNNGNPVNYRIIDVNPQFEQIIQIKKEYAIGKSATELYSQTVPPYFDIYKETALTGNPATFETYYEPLNKYFIISVFSPKKGSICNCV